MSSAKTLKDESMAPVMLAGGTEGPVEALVALLAWRPKPTALRQAASLFGALHSAARYLEAIKPGVRSLHE
jgi:hypothetical protein